MNLARMSGAWITVAMAVSLPAMTVIAFADGPAKPSQSDTASTDNPPAPASGTSPVWYQLVNVTIPEDSPLRNDSDINHPPELYVVVKRDGEDIEVTCTKQKGWSVDFEQHNDGSKNVWPIRQAGEARFTVEVWDNHFWHNYLIFNVTGLSAKDFDDVIREQGGKLVSKDRMATITFKRRTEAPVKYQSKQK